MNFNIPDLGIIDDSSGFRNLSSTTDGRFISGESGVKHIVCTGDGKVEFVAFENHTLAYVNSALGYGAYYPLHPVNRNGKIKAVLMDLDGTSVRSEEFWIWIIEKTTASILDDESFRLEDGDIPFVSGHSVSEQADLPHGTDPSPLRTEGLERNAGGDPFLDHHDDSGSYRTRHA